MSEDKEEYKDVPGVPKATKSKAAASAKSREEYMSQIPLSDIGFQPFESAGFLFLEIGEKKGIGLTFGPQENVFDIVSNNERLYVAIEVLNEFNVPLKKTCCFKQEQADHNFDLTILGSDGGEIMSIIKTTPTEVFITRGKESIGLILREDGFGRKTAPTKFIIHDEVGPLMQVRRCRNGKEPADLTDWILSSFGSGLDVAKISNFWLDRPSDDPNRKGFGIEFCTTLSPNVKAYFLAMLFTLVRQPFAVNLFKCLTSIR